MRAPFASGSSAAPCSWRAWTSTRASRRCGRRRAPWSIGGGFIGVESAENLVHRGFDVTLVEMADQVLAPLDKDMARPVEDHLDRHGVRVALNDGVAAFEQGDEGSLNVRTKSGKVYPADVVILALGVRPDTDLARAAGLQLGERGGIRVDDQMRTVRSRHLRRGRCGRGERHHHR